MKTVGIILLILGSIGTIIFGIEALSNSEAFELFGIELAVSSANWTPVIVSTVALITGIFITVSANKR